MNTNTNTVKQSVVHEALDNIKFTNGKTFKSLRKKGHLEVSSIMRTGWDDDGISKDNCQISVFIKSKGFGDDIIGHCFYSYRLMDGTSEINFREANYYPDDPEYKLLKSEIRRNQEFLYELRDSVKETLDNLFM